MTEAPASPTTATESDLSSSAPLSVADLLLGMAVPQAAGRPAFRPSSSNRLPVSADPALIHNLLVLVAERSGMSQAELARRLAIAPQSLNQYLINRRSNPHLLWMAKFVEAAGGQLVVEFPSSR